MRDLILHLQKQHENAFNHGWLAGHFGWDKNSSAGGIERGINESELSDQQLKTQHERWILGYKTAKETPFNLRCIALSKLLTLEFD